MNRHTFVDLRPGDPARGSPPPTLLLGGGGPSQALGSSMPSTGFRCRTHGWGCGGLREGSNERARAAGRHCARAGRMELRSRARVAGRDSADRYGHFVGGEWLEPKETYTTIAPATEEPLAEVGQATPEEIDAAVRAARAAFENGWSSLAPSERRSTSTGSRASCRSAHASSPCSSR